MYGYDDLAPSIRLKAEPEKEVVHYSALNENLPEEFKHFAEKALNETEDVKANGIQSLKAFARRERISLPDVWILIILRYSKYNIEKSESKLKQFNKFHQENVNALVSMDMKKIEIIIDHMVFGLLPYRDRFGRAIIFTQPSFHLDFYKPNEVMYVFFALVEFLETFAMTSICGLSYIGQMKSPSRSLHIWFINSMKYALLSALRCYPVRYGRLEFINEFFLFRWLYNALSPFVPRKITERVSFHGEDLQSLHKHYPPEIIPFEFGGTLGPLNNKFYKQKLMNFIQNLTAEHDI